ncbi:MAG: hypothetical protein ABIH42_02240, partial [Planctomycetota bacterium]
MKYLTLFIISQFMLISCAGSGQHKTSLPTQNKYSRTEWIDKPEEAAIVINESESDIKLKQTIKELEKKIEQLTQQLSEKEENKRTFQMDLEKAERCAHEALAARDEAVKEKEKYKRIQESFDATIEQVTEDFKEAIKNKEKMMED